MMTTPGMSDHRPSGGCGGDGCGVEDAWPLHHVRHRGVFCRLCTSCVLKYHPGSFCPNCFELFDGSQGTTPVVHCSGCTSVSHTSCLPSPDAAAKYICPTCANPNDFSFFPVGSKKDGALQATLLMSDLKSAKVLLASSRLALASMTKAVASCRAEAERKVKEAVVAKKRAREMLERALAVARVEREKRKQVALRGPAMAEKTDGAAAAAAVAALAKRVQRKEREKLMKFHEPMAAAATASGSFAGGDGNCLKKNTKVEDKNGVFSAMQKSFVQQVVGKAERDKKNGGFVSQISAPSQGPR